MSIDWSTVPHNLAKGAVEDLLEYIGEDLERPGLKETPLRVIQSYKELFSGYHQDPAHILKMFQEPCDEMVILKDIEMVSCCEHHMLPFIGNAHIAYIPQNNQVVGISKLARLLEVYARRLQIQERICQQVVDALMKHVEPRGAACVIEASHLCISCRGVGKQNSKMITSCLKGVFLTDAAARSEFLSRIK